MLGKLIKHEFSATARYFIPLYGIILILTPLFSLMMKLIMELDLDESALSFSLIISMATFGVFAYAFIIVASFIATLILIVIRFYKTTATSEAYLTFTLPVKTYQTILSKTLVAVVWEILAGIISAATLIVMFCILGFITPQDIFDGLHELLGSALFNLGPDDILTLSLALLSALTGVIASVLKIYCSIALGQLFRNHRVLISIGMYFGMYFALQFLSMFLSIGIILAVRNNLDSHIYFNLTYGLSIFENIIVIVAGFWVTTWLMKKHLNVV